MHVKEASWNLHNLLCMHTRNAFIIGVSKLVLNLKKICSVIVKIFINNNS